MARRFSGRVRVSVRWDDATATYACGVSWTVCRGTDWERTRCRRVRIGAPPSLTLAVDCPAAFDDAARAALAFVAADEPAVDAYAAHGASGYMVTREDMTKPRRVRAPQAPQGGLAAAFVVLATMIAGISYRA